MKIAIIGAGFTGLSASYTLLKNGHNVTIFEKSDMPGGLAFGFRHRSWQWPLEAHYHHWFTNDNKALNLAKELNHEVIIKRPKTSVYVNSVIYQLDSPFNVLTFSKLSVVERIRMASVLASLRYNPFWKPLEAIKATQFLPLGMGERTYKLLWEPLFLSKFNTYANDISLAWFWARIKKRTPSLAYPKGGFLSFANALVEDIQQKGGKIFFNTEVNTIKSNGKVLVKWKMENNKWKIEEFNKVIVTLPSFSFLNMAPQLPNDYQNKLKKLKSLGATNLVLRLKKPFFPDNTYWLSICDTTSPIMAIVEHTNFMDKKYYNNEHLVYLGNYLPANHQHMKLTADELLRIYDPYLKKINSDYSSSLIASHLFTAPFAQPIMPINYSKILPPLTTPLPNIFLANMQQVYPWDRGTNYAIELGEKVAQLIITNS